MKGDEWVNIYSCSRSVTCAAALQLFERGLFLLDDPISEYISEFGEMYVKDVDGIKLLRKEHPDADTVTVAKYIAKDTLQFEPGSRYAYSLCHDVLAAFANAMANLGKCPNGERILSSGTVNLMRTSQNVPEARQWFDNMHRLCGYEYGLGVRTLVDKACSGSNSSLGEFGWDGAGGAYLPVDLERQLAMFYAHQMTNCQGTFVKPRLKIILYGCID